MQLGHILTYSVQRQDVLTVCRYDWTAICHVAHVAGVGFLWKLTQGLGAVLSQRGYYATLSVTELELQRTWQIDPDASIGCDLQSRLPLNIQQILKKWVWFSICSVCNIYTRSEEVGQYHVHQSRLSHDFLFLPCFGWCIS